MRILRAPPTDSAKAGVALHVGRCRTGAYADSSTNIVFDREADAGAHSMAVHVPSLSRRAPTTTRKLRSTA